MTQDNSSNRNSNEPKSSGYNFVIYAFVIGLGVLFASFYLMNLAADRTLSYHELRQLVASREGYINVTHKDGQQAIRYSELDDVRIGRNAVTGRVRRSLPGSRSGEAREGDVVSFYTAIPDSDVAQKDLEVLFGDSDIDHRIAPPSVWRPWIPMLVISSLFLLGFFIVLRRLGGAGSPMAFGRSRGRLYAQEDLGVTFDDVEGIDEAVEEVREIVDFLRSPEKYQRLGGRIRKVFCSSAHLGLVRPCWRKRSPARREFRFLVSPVPILSRCS